MERRGPALAWGRRDENDMLELAGVDEAAGDIQEEDGVFAMLEDNIADGIGTIAAADELPGAIWW